jgi:hypothetical protein
VLIESGSTAVVAVVNLVAAVALATIVWTVQLLTYPQLSRVPADAYVSHQAEHMRRMSWLVGPIFTALVLTSGWLVLAPSAEQRGLALLNAALLGVTLLVTAAYEAPRHRRLLQGFDARTHHQLLVGNWPRVFAATSQAAVAALLLPA